MSTRPSLRDAMAAVDRETADDGTSYQFPTAGRPEQARVEAAQTAHAVKHETEQEAAEASKRAEAYNIDRLALSINIVMHVERQRGRANMTRKGAATVVLVKGLLDAVLTEDAPVDFKEFEPLGGGSHVDLSAIADILAGKKR